MPSVLGIEPMASTACVDSIDRPSSQRTITRSVSGRRSMASARAPINSFTPRRMNSASSTAATSGSLPGSTCWRLTTSVTAAPNIENMCTNSTPVTPDPTMVTLFGKHLGRVAVAGGQDAVAVGLAPVGDARARTRRHERGVELDRLDAFGPVDLDRVRAGEPRRCP